MIRKVIAVSLFAVLSLCVFAGCKTAKTDGSSSVLASTETNGEGAAHSSKIETSSVKTDISSHKEEKEENATIEKETSSKKEETSTIEKESSSKKEETSTIEKGSSSQKEETSSMTSSEGVKVYKNPHNLELGMFHFSIDRCEGLIEYEKDYVNKKREYKAVVESGYFNTFMMGMENYLEQAKIVAEVGGTIWFYAHNYDGKNVNLDEKIEGYKKAFKELEEHGYLDLVNGFYWDEPVPNEYFLEQSKRLYKEFGLRNFPVFSCARFDKSTGENLVKLTPETAKYITDVAFDAYSTDVRIGASNGGKYSDWQKTISPNVVDGQSYYVELRKLLQKAVGHPANFWHYPTAYRNYLWGGLNGMFADEAYCIANLEFLKKDVMEQEYPGGLILYTYYKYHGEDCLSRRLDVKNEDGEYLMYTDFEKWERYSKLLRDTVKQFKTIKPKLVNISK